MPNYSTPNALGIVYSVVARLNEDMAEGSNSASRELTKYMHDTFGVPSCNVDLVTRESNSDIEGLSILLESGHRVVVLDPIPMRIACEAVAPHSINFEGEKFIGFVDKPKPAGQSVFWGDSPDFVEGSLVAGSLPEVINHLRLTFSTGYIGS